MSKKKKTRREIRMYPEQTNSSCHPTSFVVVDGIGQGLDGLDVQVVGRLVHDEHIRRHQTQLRHGHASLLTATEVLQKRDGVLRHISSQLAEERRRRRNPAQMRSMQSIQYNSNTFKFV